MKEKYIKLLLKILTVLYDDSHYICIISIKNNKYVNKKLSNIY